jgi:formylglycine-generating enzyme required for sulfatase activity
LKGVGRPGPAEVGTFSRDQSPDGVFDLAGNVQEWTDSEPPDHEVGFRVARGGNWLDTPPPELPDFMALENPRAIVMRWFVIGARCVSQAASGSASTSD